MPGLHVRGQENTCLALDDSFRFIDGSCFSGKLMSRTDTRPVRDINVPENSGKVITRRNVSENGILRLFFISLCYFFVQKRIFVVSVSR